MPPSSPRRRPLVVASVLLLLLTLLPSHIASAQFATPTVNGTIAAGEYGTHTDGQNQQTSGGQTWYMTWDNSNLYVGISNANVAEGAVLYLDTDPIKPINGGTNANGSLVGQPYDTTRLNPLPFRANLVAYFKNGYREYRVADGAGGWSTATAGFGSYADNGSNVRELAIPWSALGGRPASFAWLGYVTSSGGSVYGTVPPENAGGTIGTDARYSRYYIVNDTNTGTATKPFSRNSYVFNSTADIPGFGAISVYDFTMNTPSRSITRGSGAWNIAGDLTISAGTINFGSVTDGATVGGNVTLDLNGTLILSTQPGGDLTLAGNWVRSGGTFTPNGRTVTFNGSSVIQGNATNLFHHLTIATGASLTGNSAQPVNLGGNWTNNGSYHANGGSVGFFSLNAQSLGGTSATTFQDLTVANSATTGLSLSQSARVEGTLTLGAGGINGGRVTLGSQTLTMGPSATIVAGNGSLDASRMIVAEGSGTALSCTGQLRKEYGGTGSFLFPIGESGSGYDYSPMTIQFTAGTFGAGASAGGCVHDVVHPALNPPVGATYLSRFWTASPSGITNYSASATFTYTDGDVVGTAEPTMIGGRWTGSTWASLGGGSVDAANNRITATALSNFSDFTASSQFSALVVTLSHFAASSHDSAVLVAWETASEQTLLGFDLLRATAPDAAPTRLNAQMIPAQAPGSSEGAAYEWVDSEATAGTSYWYWLEAIEGDGSRTRLGPVTAAPATPTAVALGTLDAGNPASRALPLLLGLVLLGSVGLLAVRRR